MVFCLSLSPMAVPVLLRKERYRDRDRDRQRARDRAWDRSAMENFQRLFPTSSSTLYNTSLWILMV